MANVAEALLGSGAISTGFALASAGVTGQTIEAIGVVAVAHFFWGCATGTEPAGSAAAGTSATSTTNAEVTSLEHVSAGRARLADTGVDAICVRRAGLSIKQQARAGDAFLRSVIARGADAADWASRTGSARSTTRRSARSRRSAA